MIRPFHLSTLTTSLLISSDITIPTLLLCPSPPALSLTSSHHHPGVYLLLNLYLTCLLHLLIHIYLYYFWKKITSFAIFLYSLQLILKMVPRQRLGQSLCNESLVARICFPCVKTMVYVCLIFCTLASCAFNVKNELFLFTYDICFLRSNQVHSSSPGGYARLCKTNWTVSSYSRVTCY